MTAVPSIPSHPEVLVRVSNELTAAVIVNTLVDQGIWAMAVGGSTSGFKAEAPGDVTVVVRAADLAHARQVLDEIRRDPGEIDASHYGDNGTDDHG